MVFVNYFFKSSLLIGPSNLNLIAYPGYLCLSLRLYRLTKSFLWHMNWLLDFSANRPSYFPICFSSFSMAFPFFSISDFLVDLKVLSTHCEKNRHVLIKNF